MNRTLRTILVYGVVVVLMVVVAQTWFETGDQAVDVTASEFVQLVEDGEIESVTIFTRSDLVTGDRVDGPDTSPDFTFSYPPEWEGTLTEILVENQVAMTAESDTSIWEVVISLLPWLFLIGFMIFIFTQMQGGGNRVMQFGKAKAKQVTRDTPKVTFDDVAGVDEAIEELEEIKEFLQNPSKFRAMGAKIPKGVLLYGPPGTGKTLLARAVAGEAGVPFFSISGSDFVEMFVGVGASRVRDLFEQAKAQGPAIIFIDEIDAVGRHRGAGLGGGHDEREQTLNQLLVELDGFDVNTGVIVIAGTNRPDILDPALLRPGRFDRQIVVDRPDLKGREAILAVHSRGKPFEDEIDNTVLARQTPGFTGADLANLINEAALLAARRDKKRIGMDELEEAIDRVIAGPERRSRVISEPERKLTAYHEGGHALVGFALPNTNPIHKVTIIPRGRSGGFTLSLPTEDRFYKRRSEMVDELALLLGGRTAEELIFGDPSTGASDDIDKATDLARKMVMEYGMSDRLGPMKYGHAAGEVFLGRDYSRQPDYSDEVASYIDSEVRKLISQAHDEAQQILTAHEDSLHRIAAELIDKETIDAEEVAALFHDVPKWEHTTDGAMRIQMPATSSSEEFAAAAHITEHGPVT
ncbi:MAG TPA: ATP-dependent zinc metalloprotease FtsH [Acidimicrobiia bacterium]|nr:ATP-dependent zinc metalloprotease FtsH [Acidimicrobiia bacterium]